jgi:hypothetical protein
VLLHLIYSVRGGHVDLAAAIELQHDRSRTYLRLA